MTSYIVYLLATQLPQYLGVPIRGNIWDANSWPYIVYPQLVKKHLQKESPKYRIVNNTFIFVVIHFMQEDYAKIFLVESITRIIQVGGYFI